MRSTLLLLSILLLSGCNSVFYQPDDTEYATPEKYKHQYESFQVKSQDGVVLSAWRIFPDQKKTLGTIVHFHGNAENMSTHMGFSEWLAKEGYEVVTFDYRGYGKSQGEPSREGLILDGKAILKHVDEDPKFFPAPVFIFAQSLGGAVAVPAYTESGVKNVKAMILDSTFGSYRRTARQKLSSFWLTWLFQWPLSFLVSDGWTAEDYINKVEIPLLIIHGTRDPVIPFSAGRELFDAAQNPKKEFWEIPNGGHTSAFGRPRGPYRARLLEFLRR